MVEQHDMVAITTNGVELLTAFQAKLEERELQE